MVYFVIFLAELLSLFLFSKLLTNSLARLFYFFTRSHKGTVSLLAALYLPGTIIHEMSHVLVAGALLVHSGEIEFLPQIREDGVKLGSAEIGVTDPLRRALIGLAPVILGSALILGLLAYLNHLITLNQASIWAYLIIFILIFELANTMFSSKKDLEGTLGVIIIVGSFISACYLLGFGDLFNWIGKLYIDHYQSFFQSAIYQLLVPIGLDLAFYLSVKVLIHKTHRLT